MSWFRKSKYSCWYFGIIDKARQRVEIEEYSECHHIRPRSLGGDDEPVNLVRLTFREHFLAHWLLTRMVEGKDRRKMWSALIHMRRQHSGRVVTSWQYALAKVAGRRAFFQRRHTKKTKEILRAIQKANPSLGMLGKTHSEKSKRKIARTRKERGIKHTKVSRAKISKSLEGNQYALGHKHSEETRQQMSVARMGNQHARGHKHTDEWKRENSIRMKRIHAERRAARLLAKQQEQTT